MPQKPGGKRLRLIVAAVVGGNTSRFCRGLPVQQEGNIMVKGFRQLPLAAAVSAVVLVTSVVAIARPADPEAQPAATSQQTDAPAQAVKQLSAEQVQMQKAAVVAAAGRSAMQHIGVAGQLLAAGDSEQATKVLKAGSEILAQLRSVFDEQGSPAGSERMVPVYASLGIAEGAEVSDAMKQGLNALAPLVASSQHAKVVERLKTFGIGLSYSYVELPLDKVSAEVSSALKALDAGDKDAAAGFLASANKAAVTETVNVGFEEPANTAQSPEVEPAADKG